MKKKLNTEAITNELAGSVFFPSRTTEPAQQESGEQKGSDTNDDLMTPRRKNGENSLLAKVLTRLNS